jgi:DNA-binding response OmpR family regulator
LTQVNELLGWTPPKYPAAMGVRIGGQMNVLLVEGDADLRSSFARALRQAGITVLEASGFSDAIRLARKATKLDILITNNSLEADADGLGLAGRIRKDQPSIFLILVSQRSEAVQAWSLGSNDRLLIAPFVGDSLLQMVRSVTAGEGDMSPGAASHAELDGWSCDSMWSAECNKGGNPLDWLPTFRWRR